jgi:hypothetical protein
LKCAQLGANVFGESIAEIATEKGDIDSNTFAEEMLDFESKSADVHELIQMCGKKKGIKQSVLDYLATKKEDRNE